MSNVVSLQSLRDIRKAEADDSEYKARILGMNKIELLEEMVVFQQERTTLGHLTVMMMIRGRILFRALEQNAETQELLLLTRSYRRHLDLELAEYAKNGRLSESG